MTRAGICAALFSAIIFSAFLSTITHAATTHHRLIWDSDPAHNAVVGFSPNGTSTAPYVKYGVSTDEAQRVSQQPASSQQFNNGLLSYFVRLTNLPEDSAIYYRVCDNSGCGERFWFKTAPTDIQPFVAVAGGDSRTGWTTRRAGNSLIAKIRPLFIMHGGDFTNANNIAEITEFLSDWTLTFSSDTINNIAYKRIYPLIPTHGNHEDNNFRTLCQVFGVDYNGDGQCTTADTYGAFNISPLLRVYTLNTQYANSGWSSYANAMNTWLADDLYANGTDTTWRFAQYHKPMFPHYTGKPDNPHLFSWWANHFYNYGMNLVVESDTHINKLTKAIRPSGSTFVETTTGGTVYVGEGSWGAPARSANNPRPWTIDLASIQQFKVITVTEDNIEVRTAQFDDTASTLTRTQRENDPTILPANVNWWSANSIGETLTLVQNAAGQSIIDNGVASGDTIELSATDDTFVSTSQATQNFNGSSEGLLADGLDTTYGAMEALIKWDVSSLPECADISAASVQIDVFNPSSGNYQIFAGTNSWSESSATWNAIGGSAHRGVLMGSFNPSSTGVKTITLSSAGITAIKGWLQGGNNGIVIAANGSTDGIDFRSQETGFTPKLILTYSDTGSCGTTTTTELTAAHDTFVSSTQNNQNLNNSSDGLLADGSDSIYGVMNTLVKWNLSSIPACAIITSASVKLNITNPSPGSYLVRSGVNTWSEQTATWNSVGGTAHQGTQLASFTASSTGIKTVPLTSSGITAVQGWLQGTNNGIVIASGGTTDGIDIYSKEQGAGPVLVLEYQQNSGCSTSTTSFSKTTQAEHYSSQFDIQLENTADTNGGQNVGWIDAGDWMAYSGIHIPATGTYTVEYRVASPNNGGRLRLDLNGGTTVLGTVDITNTGGWQNWTTLSHSVDLVAGTHDFGIQAASSGWNINWWRISR